MHVRLALAVAGALLFAGCSDDPEPTPKIPDPTTSSPSPTDSESETPEAESPEDFIRRWLDVEREMQASGDVDQYRQLGPDCAPCQDTADRVETIYQQGGSIEWAGSRVLDISSYGNTDDQFRVKLQAAPTRYRESSDGPWQRLDGGSLTRLIELKQEAQGWLVINTAELAQ